MCKHIYIYTRCCWLGWCFWHTHQTRENISQTPLHTVSRKHAVHPGNRSKTLCTGVSLNVPLTLGVCVSALLLFPEICSAHSRRSEVSSPVTVLNWQQSDEFTMNVRDRVTARDWLQNGIQSYRPHVKKPSFTAEKNVYSLVKKSSFDLAYFALHDNCEGGDFFITHLFKLYLVLKFGIIKGDCHLSDRYIACLSS